MWWSMQEKQNKKCFFIMLSASAWQYTARLRCFNLNTILYTLVIEELLFIYLFLISGHVTNDQKVFSKTSVYI